MNEHARAHGDNGHRVHPLKPGGKTPLLKGWQIAATSSPAQIGKWWQRWPNANVGVVIEKGESFTDVDTPYAHDEFRERVPTETRTVRTPRGGWHYLWSGPLPNRVLIKEDGGRPLEVKGPGTNRVAPGSVCPDGTWTLEVDIPPAPPPLELIKWIGESRTDRPTTPGCVGRGELAGPITQGRRNMTLTNIGGYLRRIGGTQESIEAFLLTHNQQFSQPPLEEEEVKRIAASVAGYSLGPPWLDAWGYAGEVVTAYGLGPTDRAVLTVLYRGAKDNGLVRRGVRRLEKETSLSKQPVLDARARVINMQLVDVVKEDRRWGTTFQVKSVLDGIQLGLNSSSVLQSVRGTTKGGPSGLDVDHSQERAA